MWFKNLQLFRVPKNWDLTAEDLAAQLKQHSFQPAGSFALESRGWIPPRGDDQLVYALNRQWLIALGVEQKLLPASVIRQTAKERAAKLEGKGRAQARPQGAARSQGGHRRRAAAARVQPLPRHLRVDRPGGRLAGDRRRQPEEAGGGRRVAAPLAGRVPRHAAPDPGVARHRHDRVAAGRRRPARIHGRSGLRAALAAGREVHRALRPPSPRHPGDPQPHRARASSPAGWRSPGRTASPSSSPTSWR